MRMIKDSVGDFRAVLDNNMYAFVVIAKGNTINGEFDTIDEFLDECDDYAESMNGFYSINTTNDDMHFVVDFYTSTPMDMEPEDYTMDGEYVDSVTFDVVFNPIYTLEGLQDYVDLRNKRKR